MRQNRPAAFNLPLAILKEAQNQIISVETRHGVEYRGCLEHVSAQMNLSLSSVSVIGPDGGRARKSRVLVRGGSVLMVVLPEALEDAPQLDTILQVKQAREEAFRARQALRKKRPPSVPVESGAARSSDAKPQLKRSRVFLESSDAARR
ncbi:hypothetical protein CCYA_CCYA09G2545 [Cyanidiococcus yangmingshanensis]|nr:hypothetical protein CCYA_CCYA09G2545 [Cyanidiococcus yangmingshanensis]